MTKYFPGYNMDKIAKALLKLSNKERIAVKELLEKIKKGDISFRDLDIKKLKNFDNIFRIRKGKIRIIFLKEEKKIKLLTIERRNNNIYNI